jgi:hypothetical protein
MRLRAAAVVVVLLLLLLRWMDGRAMWAPHG